MKFGKEVVLKGGNYLWGIELVPLTQLVWGA